MTTVAATSQAAYRTITSRTRRAYATALCVNVGIGALISSGWLSIVMVMPSIGLASAVLLTGWQRPPHRPLLISSALVSGATLAWSALSQSTPLGSLGFGITAAVWIIHQRRPRRPLALLVCLVIITVNVLMVWMVAGQVQDWVATVPMMVFGLIWVLVIVEGNREFQLYDLLNRAKDAEREASILRERSRFAADLHDIQGHTLHVIKLKAAVAARLQHTDPERTAEELAAIQRLTAETIEEARSLAHSTHRLVLAAELANAVELLEAAGISIEVQNAGAQDTAFDADFALVLREATTNILRHSRAERVGLTITEDSLTICNDGAPREQRGTLGGLANLRQRISTTAGGVLSVDQDGEMFTVSAQFGQGQA
ncbi:sensor histidine kinase [Nesterenkonia muleiensis]|uniref:sensor histidine kinase n=1 Tax=Nesterenkonia muleiensis TaxID=2282648 RepID=UPI000E71F8E1|nr:histidine kinase [Nesterenkonia muleiensis]